MVIYLRYILRGILYEILSFIIIVIMYLRHSYEYIIDLVLDNT